MKQKIAIALTVSFLLTALYSSTAGAIFDIFEDDTNQAESLSEYHNYTGDTLAYLLTESYSDDEFTGYSYDFDEDGWLIREAEYNSDYVVTAWKEYTYDDNRNLSKVEEYNSIGKVEACTEYTYNDAGMLIQCMEYSDGVLRKLERYNDNGDILQRSFYYSYGELEYEYTYEYDDAGNLIVMTDYDSSLGTGVATYKYNDNGQMISGIKKAIEEGITLYVSCEYDMESNTVTETTVFEDGTIFQIHSYYVSGEALKHLYYDLDGSFESWDEYGYDSEMNRVSEASFFEDGSLEYYYEYDTSGNKIVDKQCNRSGEVKSWTGYLYDESDNVIKEISYTSDGVVDSWIEYNRNSEGELISKIEYDANGTVVESSEYIPSDIEYDADGNLISKISYSSDGSVSKTYEYAYSEDGVELYYSYTNFSTGKNEYKKHQSIAEYLVQKVSVTYPAPSDLEYLILKTTEGTWYYSDSEGIHEYSYSYTRDYNYDENGNPDGMTINYDFGVFGDGTVSGDFEVDCKGNVISEIELGFSFTEGDTLHVYTPTVTYTYYNNSVIMSKMVESNDDNFETFYFMYDEYGLETQFIYNFYSETAATGYYYINNYDNTSGIPSEVVQTSVKGTFIYNSADNMYYFYDGNVGTYSNTTYNLSFDEDGHLTEKYEDGSNTYYTREYDSNNRIILVKSYGTYDITTAYDSDVLELGSTATYVYGTVSDSLSFEENGVTDITIDHISIEESWADESTYTAYSTVTAYEENGNAVWSYRTDEYTMAELTAVYEIGIRDDTYYFVDCGNVTALNLYNGDLLWKNSDSVGSGGTVIGDDAIYLCGYYGPDFSVISYSGETVKQIDTFYDEFFWAYKVELPGEGTALVYMDGTYDESLSSYPFIVCVDLSTWEYYLKGENENNTMETAEVVSIEAVHMEEEGYEYTIIYAYDSDNNIVWSYQTEKYMLADMPRLNDIGLNGDYYYYSEYGKIIALEKNTGTIMWENTSLTSGTKTDLHTFDEYGNLYGFGVIEPECDLTFFAIDINGDLLGTIDQSSFIYTYLGAVSLEVYDGQAIAVIEDYEYGGTTTFYIDLNTFTCSTNPNTDTSSNEDTDSAILIINEEEDSDFITVQVSAPDGGVNMRTSAGVENDLVYSMIPNGTILTITEQTKASNGNYWGYTVYNGYSGWIAMTQVTVID